MRCCLVRIDKRTGVCPVRISEAILRALAKLVLREAQDQYKTERGNFQFCARLEAGIEGPSHDVEKWRRERVGERKSIGVWGD